MFKFVEQAKTVRAADKGFSERRDSKMLKIQMVYKNFWLVISCCKSFEQNRLK